MLVRSLDFFGIMHIQLKFLWVIWELLTIGGIIAVIAIAVRKEWLIPLLCGIFLIENLSVVLQVSYFKYTRKKFGEGEKNI